MDAKFMIRKDFDALNASECREELSQAMQVFFLIRPARDEYISQPHWFTRPLAMSGYHIRESGSSATQEIAFTFANARAYLDELVRRGVSVDDVAPTLFTFLAITTDVLQEVAKFRAARRVWARLMRDRFLFQEVWEKTGLPTKQCMEIALHNQGQVMFRQMLFAKIVPAIKKMDLLSDRQRQRFQDLGILQFENWADPFADMSSTAQGAVSARL